MKSHREFASFILLQPKDRSLKNHTAVSLVSQIGQRVGIGEWFEHLGIFRRQIDTANLQAVFQRSSPSFNEGIHRLDANIVPWPRSIYQNRNAGQAPEALKDQILERSRIFQRN